MWMIVSSHAGGRNACMRETIIHHCHAIKQHVNSQAVCSTDSVLHRQLNEATHRTNDYIAVCFEQARLATQQAAPEELERQGTKRCMHIAASFGSLRVRH